VLTKDWYHNPDDVLSRIEKLLQGQGVVDEDTLEDDEPAEVSEPAAGEAAQTVAVTPAPSLPKEAAPPPVLDATPAGDKGADAVRRFEFVGGSSRKFWEISVSGNSFTVRFGRIGTTGQSQAKSFANATKAKREASSLIAEKLKKGYIEKN
jgi:predicted DNA-binding WGR domain protein